jgi:hypothetical protein
VALASLERRELFADVGGVLPREIRLFLRQVFVVALVTMASRADGSLRGAGFG